jgi:DNA-binding NarL/FixJ family response regulator
MLIRVLLCDDQGLVRIGLRTVLAGCADLEVVGEANGGHGLVSVAQRLQSDVAVIDILLLEQIGELSARKLAVRGGIRPCGIVILADRVHATDDQLVAALRAGARGLVQKEGPPEELIQAIRVVAAGQAFVTASFTRQLLDRFATTLPAMAPSLAMLTPRERQILGLVGQGMSNGEIATVLSLCDSTVKFHVSGMLAKLGLNNRAQAVAVAFRAGLIPG